MRTDTRANGMLPAAVPEARPVLAALAPCTAGNSLATPLAPRHTFGAAPLPLIRLTLALTCPAMRRAGSIAG